MSISFLQSGITADTSSTQKEFRHAREREALHNTRAPLAPAVDQILDKARISAALALPHVFDHKTRRPHKPRGKQAFHLAGEHIDSGL